MATETQSLELRLIRRADGLELDLRLLQGLWTDEQYLALSNQTNHLIEFADGQIEVLPMPTRSHQLIVRWVFLALYSFLQPSDGLVLFAPFRLQIRPGRYREPDVLLLRNAADPRNQESFWLGADLVVEIVSPDDPERDLTIKRADYAAVGVTEYWIVNPLDETITVLALSDGDYQTVGRFVRGQPATSRLLDGFSLAVDEVLDAR